MSDWQDDPATDRQREFGKDLGIAIPQDATKGEASAVIDDAVAERDASRAPDSAASLMSTMACGMGIVLGIGAIASWGSGLHALSVAIAALALIILFVGTRRKRQRNRHAVPIRSDTYDPTHAKPGTFDENDFKDPRTGKFRFPKYKHDKQFLVKITDKTNYKEDMWEDLEPDERREFTIEDFEDYFSGPDLEVDSFESLFYRASPSHLAPLKYLKDNYSAVQTVAAAADDEWVILDSSNAVLRRLVDEGLLTRRKSSSSNEKLNYFKKLKAADLQRACKKAGINSKGRKQENIDAMISSGMEFDLPPAILPSQEFKDWLDALVGRYVDDIRRNADRFHPLYIEPIWAEAELVNRGSLALTAIKQVLATRYWLDRLKH